jgi:hypothetical protein
MRKVIYDINEFNERVPSTFNAPPDHIPLGIRLSTHSEDGYPSIEVRVEDYIRIDCLPWELREAILAHISPPKWS